MGTHDVDAYMDAVPEPQRSTLAQVRTTLEALLPHAEQTISYGSPTFNVGGKGVAGFAAFAHHCSYLPMSGGVAGHAGRRAVRLGDDQGVGEVPGRRATSQPILRRLHGRCPARGTRGWSLSHGSKVLLAAPLRLPFTSFNSGRMARTSNSPSEHIVDSWGGRRA